MRITKRKIRFLIVILNVIFAIAVFYLFAKTGEEPDALIVAWFAFIAAVWKYESSSKKRKENDDDQENSN